MKTDKKNVYRRFKYKQKKVIAIRTGFIAHLKQLIKNIKGNNETHRR